MDNKQVAKELIKVAKVLVGANYTSMNAKKVLNQWPTLQDFINDGPPAYLFRKNALKGAYGKNGAVHHRNSVASAITTPWVGAKKVPVVVQKEYPVLFKS